MINRIINDPELFSILREECSENGFCVNVCEHLTKNGHLDSEKVIILKPDEFYNTKNYATPPKSIDCLFIIKRENEIFDLTLVELRNSKRGELNCPLRIQPKFNNTVNFFLKQDFREIFEDARYKIGKIKAYFIAEPIRQRNISEEEYRKKLASPFLERLALCKAMKFRGKIFSIEHKRPNPEIC